MLVKLVSHTPNVEQVLVRAFSQCYQLERQGKKANIDVVRRNIKHQSVLEHAVLPMRQTTISLSLTA